MKKSWNDPAKRPAKESTMNTEGDFGKFTDLMRKLVSVPHSEMTRRLEKVKAYPKIHGKGSL
jgi:hypothetical protein